MFRMRGVKRVTPTVVPQHLQLVSHRHLQAVDLSFQNWVPCNLPLPPKLVLRAFHHELEIAGRRSAA